MAKKPKLGTKLAQKRLKIKISRRTFFWWFLTSSSIRKCKETKCCNLSHLKCYFYWTNSFFPEKVENFFFQIFSVINMKVQLKYFYYCSIVIMVSRLGDGHWGQFGLLIDVDIVFFRKKLKFFFSNFFCNQYESSIEVFLLLFYCYNGI